MDKSLHTLVTRDQPYLFATIFKHFIYVCFQLLILMNENQLKSIRKNLKTTNKKLNIPTKIQPFWNVLKTFSNSCFVTRVVCYSVAHMQAKLKNLHRYDECDFSRPQLFGPFI